MAPIDSAVIDTKDNSKVLNDVVAIESVIVPVNNNVKKSKAILHCQNYYIIKQRLRPEEKTDGYPGRRPAEMIQA